MQKVEGEQTKGPREGDNDLVFLIVLAIKGNMGEWR